MGAIIIGNSNVISIDFESNATSGYLAVTGLNDCGNGSVSQNYTITVNPLQEQSIISSSGSTSFCEGDSVVLSSSFSTGNLWSNNSTQNNITVYSSGSYYVTTSNLFGCSSTSETTLVVVYPNPVPLISLVSGQLVSTSAVSYQWYLDDVILSNETSQTLTPLVNGSYTVSVEDENGCIGVSQAYIYSTVDIANSDISNLVTIYPNPTSNSFEIICPAKSTIKIYDMMGKLLRNISTINSKSTIDVSDFSTGIYSIKVSNSFGNYTLKLVKN